MIYCARHYQPEIGPCLDAPGQAVVATLPRPFYCLGRPMPALVPWTPPEFEARVSALVDLCLKSRAAGAPLVAAADWPYESALFRLLAVTGTRLRREGFTVAFRGTRYCGLAAPVRPKADIVILLEAAGYAALGPWLETRPGEAVVLVGPEADWRLRADLPIDFLAEGSDRCFPNRVVQNIQHIRELWESADAEVRSALLLNALGCDVPRSFLPASEETPFLAVGGDDLLTLPGQWLAWQALAPLTGPLNKIWEGDAVRRAPPHLLERAAYRFAMRKAAKKRLRAVRGET